MIKSRWILREISISKIAHVQARNLLFLRPTILGATIETTDHIFDFFQCA